MKITKPFFILGIAVCKAVDQSGSHIERDDAHTHLILEVLGRQAVGLDLHF